MKIQTINDNGLLTHFGQITKYIKERDPDIVCLQETKCTDQDHSYNLLDKEVGGITYTNSKLSKHGVAIILRKIALNFKIKEIELNQIIFKNRVCHVQIQAKETVNIINVYAPSGDTPDKVTFFKSLQDYLSLYKSSTIILLGNLNYVLENNDRINHLLPYDKKIHNVFQPQKLGLRDTFGKIHGDKREYTY